MTEIQITQHSKVYDLIYMLEKNVGTTNVIWYRQTCQDYLKCHSTDVHCELWHLAVCRAVTIVSQELTPSTSSSIKGEERGSSDRTVTTCNTTHSHNPADDNLCCAKTHTRNSHKRHGKYRVC